MESEVRYRLSALEERCRETYAMSLAIKASLAALPEIADADRSRALQTLEDLLKDLPDSAAIQTRATRHLEDVLSAVPERRRL
jgi:hypothetical protein